MSRALADIVVAALVYIVINQHHIILIEKIEHGTMCLLAILCGVLWAVAPASFTAHTSHVSSCYIARQSLYPAACSRLPYNVPLPGNRLSSLPTNCVLHHVLCRAWQSELRSCLPRAAHFNLLCHQATLHTIQHAHIIMPASGHRRSILIAALSTLLVQAALMTS